MAGRLGESARFAARLGVWLLLGGWLGALVFFSAVLAPTVFQVLPSAELAGRVVSPSLSILNLYGAVAGVLLCLLALALGRGWLVAALPLVLTALCLASQFGVTPAIAELRTAAFAADDPVARAHWDRLHRASVGLFGLTQIGVLILLGLHTRAAGPDAGNRRENS